jgi:CBS domain-containing protein
MSGAVIAVESKTPIAVAHEIMKKNKIRRLPVVDNGKLQGIVTIGDVREASPSGATTLSIWELNYLWAQLKVENVMTRKVLTVGPDEPIVNAAKLMLENKISGVPVVEDGEVVGVVTESDVFRMLVKAQTEELEHL